MASRKTVNSELFKRAIMDEDRKRAASQARRGTAAAAAGTAEGSAGSASGETPAKAYGYEGSAPAQPPATQTPKSVTGGSGYKAAGGPQVNWACSYGLRCRFHRWVTPISAIIYTTVF